MKVEVLLDEVVIYAEAVENALNNETDHLNRSHYLGHLAMVARIFLAVRTEADLEKLKMIVSIERRSNALTLPGEPAAAVRHAWDRLLPTLEDFIFIRL